MKNELLQLLLKLGLFLHFDPGCEVFELFRNVYILIHIIFPLYAARPINTLPPERKPSAISTGPFFCLVQIDVA